MPSSCARRRTARRNSATGTKGNRPGFTLIELVLVLVILALAGALAVPALQPALEATRIEAAARRVAAFLDDARRVSVLERAALVVRCVPGERRLVVEGGGEAAAKLRFPTLPAAVTAFACEPERLTYLPQGSATGFTIVLRDSRGRGRRLSVGAFTGLARVETAD